MAEQTKVLLTGATGLVGRFLLAGLMRRQVPTVVLVRSQAHRSALARIDEALAPFETQAQLPRPIVLEGDLTAPGLGLNREAHQWLQAQRLRILHSAASIRFIADSPDNEPYATNVQGTQSLLDLASSWTVEQFHHVSTAYVQCDRIAGKSPAERTAFEIPVNSLEKAGNDYERSKIQSEQLVQQCPHLGVTTVYRPSIVVGDSRTGYTSTYHGFYAPLQIALGVAKGIGLTLEVVDDFRRGLGLRSHDTKNLVPVDWLAEAILHLMHTPTAWGGIYHLTHPRPAKLIDMQRAIIDALVEHVEVPKDRSSSLQINPELFRQQMAVYESYFQDDPPFDRARAHSFLKSLPCPAMDYTALKHLALAALRNNFGWPKPPPPPPPSYQLSCSSSIKGPEANASTAVRDVDLELQFLGAVRRISLPTRTVRFYRRGSLWRTNWVLSSSTTDCAWKLVVTEQSLLTALSERLAPEEMLSRGSWVAQGALPKDWLDIVRDWLSQLNMNDVQKPGSAIISPVG